MLNQNSKLDSSVSPLLRSDKEENVQQKSDVSWVYKEETWQVEGNPPDCPEPLILDSPVELTLVSGILYPGQIRGDFKAHGGFRFDNRDTNDIEVRAVMDGYILKASRYEDGGEIQNFLFYVNDCGIMVMNDHLLTLSPKLQQIFDKLPIGKDGDSRTTEITPRVILQKGEVMATEIGYKRSFSTSKQKKNIFVDFGLYDLRKTNGTKSINEYSSYGLCWFDNLSLEDENLVRNLPAGGKEGKISDYCK